MRRAYQQNRNEVPDLLWQTSHGYEVLASLLGWSLPFSGCSKVQGQGLPASATEHLKDGVQSLLGHVHHRCSFFSCTSGW